MTQRVLVIDDQPGITAAIVRVAGELGLEARAVRESSKATEAFLEFSPDLVILDMVMPEKDGIDVLDEIMLTGQPTRIVIMSGYGDAYLRLAQGVATFHGAAQLTMLRKPFRRQELETMLRSVFGLDPAPQG